MFFSKKDLGSEYKWAIDPKESMYAGSPSRRLFDRWNGDQVLFIINSFAATTDNFSVEEGKKIESLIINHLPLNTQSELSVYNWLQAENLKLN